MKARVRIKGLDAMARKLRAMARTGPNELVDGTRLLGELVMTDVKASRPGAGVPKDTGLLASTGRVDGPDARKVVRLTFGGTAAPYALVQHEVVHYRHRLGEARYLVRGLEKAVSGGTPEQALQAVLDEVIRIGKATQ